MRVLGLWMARGLAAGCDQHSSVAAAFMPIYAFRLDLQGFAARIRPFGRLWRWSQSSTVRSTRTRLASRLTTATMMIGPRQPHTLRPLFCYEPVDDAHENREQHITGCHEITDGTSVSSRKTLSLSRRAASCALLLVALCFSPISQAQVEAVWLEDALPAGATPAADGGDSWNWMSTNPSPYSGALAHQSAMATGEHQHYFYNATATLSVAVGDSLFSYVYLDPANPPSEVMLQWNNGSWEHRA